MQVLCLIVIAAIQFVYGEFKLDGKSPLCWHAEKGIACPEELAFDMSEAKTVVNANAGMDVVFAALLPQNYVLYINGERERMIRWTVDGFHTARGHLRVCELDVVCSPYTEDDDLVTKTNFEKQVFRSDNLAPYEQKLVFPSAGEYQVVASMRLAGRYSGSLNKRINYEFDIAIGLLVYATQDGELPAGVTYPANPVGPVDESQKDSAVDDPVVDDGNSDDNGGGGTIDDGNGGGDTIDDENDNIGDVGDKIIDGARDESSNKDDGGSSGTIIVVVVGLVVVGVVAALLVVRNRKKKEQPYPNTENNSQEHYHTSATLPVVHANESFDHSKSTVGSSVFYAPHVASERYSMKASDRSLHSTSTMSTALDGSGPSRSTLDELSNFEAYRKCNIASDQVRVLNVIGSGSFGEVYRGEYSSSTVAIKRIHAFMQHSEAENFVKEIELLTELRHPNIVQFIGTSWIEPFGLCAVTEFLARGDLTTILHNASQHDLSWRGRKMTIAIGIAKSLAYLHNLPKPIVHRDVKSRNVLISEYYEPKLSDFGLSRTISMDTTMTHTGSNLWLAPEIILGQRFTEKVDIYSFGVILTELDSEKLPFHDFLGYDGNRLPAIAITHKVAFEQVRPSMSKDLHPKLKQLADSCMLADANARPSAMQAIEELANLQL